MIYPLVIAHRGASGLAKRENTLEAFELAIKLKAEYVEFDVRKTADGWLVVFHDEKIEGRPISKLTFKELCELSSKEGYKIPLLKEVLECCRGKIKLDIELKETGFEKTVVNMVRSEFGYDEFVIKSFSKKAIIRVKKYDENVTTGLLVGRRHITFAERMEEFFPLRALKNCRADFLAPNYSLISKCYVRNMHKRGYKVFVWTVNTPKRIKKCLWCGADAVITDRPDMAIKIFNSIRRKV